LGEQQSLAGGLMRRSSAVELIRMHNLAGIVQNDADPDEVCVMGDAQTPKLHQKQVGRLADQARMGYKPWRCAQRHQEIAGFLLGPHPRTEA